jgi:hypothetical protein
VSQNHPLIMAGPLEFARLGAMMPALNRDIERVFDPSRKGMKWGRRRPEPQPIPLCAAWF